MAATIVPPQRDGAVLSPPSVRCPNCGSTMVVEFCAQCGELQPSHRDLSIAAVAHDAVQEFVGVDGKIPRTLWALITKPGVLTREFIDGRRGRYSKPLSLFLALNVIFFFIQPHTGLLRYSLRNYIGVPGDVNDGRAARLVDAKLASSGESRASYEARFNATLSDQKKSMLLFAVPIFAIAMGGIFARTKRYFVEHLVFAVHAYAFLLVLLAVGIAAFFYTIGGWLAIASVAGFRLGWLHALVNTQSFLIFVVTGSMAAYLTVAIRRAYGGSRSLALTRGAVLSFVQMALVLIYHDLLFFTVFYST
jgi:hypothetical protein